MKYDTILKQRILLKIIDTKEHLTVGNANNLLDRILEVNDVFQPNIIEWLEDKSFSDIWIRDKYCINAVMEIRGNNDFLSALIALDDYLNNESKEYALWLARA